MLVDRMQELKSLGVSTLVDPCPIDLGRDVEFAAEVAQASGVHVVCATGLYKEESGGAAYFKFRGAFGDAVNEMTEIFIREVSEGIGSPGLKAGVIKVATGPHQVPPYERNVLIAAARAHKHTGTPITTHTDEGTMGREQLAILREEGVDPSCIIVGHSCGSAPPRSHTHPLPPRRHPPSSPPRIPSVWPHSSACSASASSTRLSSRTTPSGAGAAGRYRQPPKNWRPSGTRGMCSSISFPRSSKPASRRRRSTRCSSTIHGAISADRNGEPGRRSAGMGSLLWLRFTRS